MGLEKNIIKPSSLVGMDLIMGWDGTVPYEIYVNSTGYAAGETAGGDTYYAGDSF